MDIQRRELLQLGLTATLITQIPQKALGQSSENQRHHKPSILQGATDESSTQFSIVYKNGTNINFVVTDEDEEIIPDDVVDYRFNKNLPLVSKVYFSGLNPDSIYILHISDADTNEIIDRRIFKTLDTEKENLRFALCSCMDDGQHRSAIWKDLVRKQPDVIFFLGDSVYTDKEVRGTANPETLWRRFCEARQTLDIYFSEKLIPIIATWDDHDFGKNDSDNSYPYIEESQKNFLTFYAQDESHCSLIKKGFGVGSALKYQDHLFLFMDDRSFRLHQGSGNRYAHWGEDQEEWMYDLLRRHTGMAWIMNGSQMFPAMIFKESFSGDHSENFESMIKELREMPCRIVFCSGDVHFSEISKIEINKLGYETYELTSSSVHSRGVPPWLVPNSRRIESTGERNYLMVDVAGEVSGNGFPVHVTSHSAHDEINFKRTLKV